MRNLTVVAAMPDLNSYLTTQDVAEKLGFSVTGVRNLVYKGKLQAVRVGRTILVKRKSLDAYLRRTRGMKTHDPRRRLP